MNVTAADVRAWADLSLDGAPDIVVEPIILAVEECIGEDYDVPDPVPERVKLAERMQVARLLKRRKTAEGVSQFGSELVIRVDRLDRDVEALLRSLEPARLGEG